MGVLCIVAFFFSRRREPTKRPVSAFLCEGEKVTRRKAIGESWHRSRILFVLCILTER